MDTADLIARIGLTAATFVVSLVSAIVPFVYVEVFLLGAVALAPADYPLWALGIVAAAGQMAGKSALYWGAVAATRPRDRHRADAAEAGALRRRMARMSPHAIQAFTFASALAGFPPFILVAAIAGALRTRFGPFLLTGFAGRLIRFVAIVVGAAAVRDAVV